MYINHDYNQLNKIIQYKLDNYKLKNDPNFNDKDIVIYSYSEIMSKSFILGIYIIYIVITVILLYLNKMINKMIKDMI